MPSITLSGALLSLAEHHDPWDWEVWRSHTNMAASPLKVGNVGDLPEGWTASTQQNVRVFAEAYWAQAHPDQFIKKKSDEYAAGRNSWNFFVHYSWSLKWEMNWRIDETMAAKENDAWGIMKNLKVSEVPVSVSVLGLLLD